MTDFGPLLNIQVAQKVNLGGYNSAEISVGVSRLPFDASEDDISRALETGDVAVRMILERVRAEVARIRMEDVYPPKAPDLHLDAFEAEHPAEYVPFSDVDQETGEVFSDSVPDEPDDLQIVPPVEEDIDPVDAEAANMLLAAIRKAFGPDPDDPVPPLYPRPSLSNIQIVEGVDMLSGTIVAYGVEIPRYTVEQFTTPIKDRDSDMDSMGTGGQLKALNTVLTNSGVSGAMRHRMCECVIDAWHRGRWGRVDEERRITSLYDLSHAEGSMCLEVLNASEVDFDVLKKDAQARYSARLRALSASQGQTELLV